MLYEIVILFLGDPYSRKLEKLLMWSKQTIFIVYIGMVNIVLDIIL